MITKQEAMEKFPGSIRDINGVQIGKWYKKVYSHLGNYGTIGMVTRIEFSIWDHGSEDSNIEPIIYMINPYSRREFERTDFDTFSSDCGVTPYHGYSYNATNYLIESNEKEAIANG